MFQSPRNRVKCSEVMARKKKVPTVQYVSIP